MPQNEYVEEEDTGLELEKAREKLIEKESASFSERKKAVLNYVDALGLNSEGIILEKDGGAAKIAHRYNFDGESEGVKDYVDELMSAIREYMLSGIIRGFELEDGESTAETLIEAGGDGYWAYFG